MILYLDGRKVAGDPATTTAVPYAGYWRIGYGNLSGWPTPPANYFFHGSLRFAAVYGTSLTPTEITDHYHAGL